MGCVDILSFLFELCFRERLLDEPICLLSTGTELVIEDVIIKLDVL